MYFVLYHNQFILLISSIVQQWVKLVHLAVKTSTQKWSSVTDMQRSRPASTIHRPLSSIQLDVARVVLVASGQFCGPCSALAAAAPGSFFSFLAW